MVTLLCPISVTSALKPAQLARTAASHAPASLARSRYQNAIPKAPRSLHSRHVMPPVHVRTVASSVSNRPASQTFEHAALNIREEAGNVASDIKKAVTGESEGTVKEVEEKKERKQKEAKEKKDGGKDKKRK